MSTSDNSYWHTSATAPISYREWSHDDGRIQLRGPSSEFFKSLEVKLKEPVPIKEPEQKEFLFDPKELDI